jgi:hypothetical protein
MKLYEIAYPDELGNDVVEVLTEDEIINQYYTYWSTKMIQNCSGEAITRERCIEDWCVVHWATQVHIPI